MANLINTSVNNALASLSNRAPKDVTHAIGQASRKTGVDFAYLMQQAHAESSFKADAKAKTSSASGLFQFIESTWMNMVDKYGPKHGISTEGKSRDEVLEMRNDPTKASVMAAEFASENERFLRSHYKGDIGSTELYFAHFMGAGGAASLLNARDENGMQKAAYIFPKAAQANKNVFYHKDGSAKSLDEVYAHFDQKFDDGGVSDVRVAQAPYKPQPKVHNEVDQLRYETLSYAQLNPFGSFSSRDLVSNPLELLMLAQMDLPINSKDGEFELFSARSLYK